jgi:DNA topoisomerase I
MITPSTTTHYGLTPLRNRHVAVEGPQLRFQFTGKGGKKWSVAIRDRRVVKIVRACQELPGQELLQYVDEAGERQDVTSADVNDYLHGITGENETAKDFRTWGATVLAALAVHELEEFDSTATAKKNIRAAIERVASRLGNTPTICRKCYIYREALTSYVEGTLLQEMKTEAELNCATNWKD